MQPPANLQNGQVGITTGVINVEVIQPVVVAPGLGFRLRIWAIHFSINISSTPANARVRARWLALSALTTMAIETTQMPYAEASFPGGFPLDENAGLQCGAMSNIANTINVATAFYTIEAVS